MEKLFDNLDTTQLYVLYDDVHVSRGVLVGFGYNVNPDQVNIMTKLGRGLIYVCIKEEKAQKLNISEMVNKNENFIKKPFGISIDFKETTTGISALERAQTIAAMTREDVVPDDFKRPGHIFPLIGKENGLMERTGFTEAAIYLAELNTKVPIAYTCEILNEVGDVANKNEIIQMAEDNKLSIIRVSEVIKHIQRNSMWVDVICNKSVFINSDITLKEITFYNKLNDTEFLVLMKEGKDVQNFIFHSECFLGDLLGIKNRCSCPRHLNDYYRDLLIDKVDCIVFHRKENDNQDNLNTVIGNQLKIYFGVLEKKI